ncbi:MAG: hypothetical protein ABW063_15475 [Caulobacter sp.]
MRHHSSFKLQPWRLTLGVLLTAIGSVCLLAALVLVYGHTPFISHWRITIGIASTMLATGLAQVCMLIGAWLLFSAWRRRP